MHKIMHRGTKIQIIVIYVVETNDFPFSHSCLAMDSANLFFNPKVNPISKNWNQTIIDERVNHIPYNSEFKYPKVIGTNSSDMIILILLIINDQKIFFFTIIDL